MYTVEVATAASGYLLRESPDDPNAISDPESPYGNPKQVQVTDNSTTTIGFYYDPVITVSATVRDAWTMERLEGAAIEFIVQASTNSISVCKYPWTASYASNWTSQINGAFPANTILYLEDRYDLKISMAGYQTFISNSIITNASAGDTFDLGDIFMVPVDINTNLVDDLWEIIYFGTYVSATADPDCDGVCNRDEYLAGTDPTGSASVLHLSQTVSNDTLTLTWNTEPGRSYRVTGTTDLSTGTWVQVGGTWEATNGQSCMSWTETNMHLSWQSSYCVEVVPCYWTGTNQVLIRTNDWPAGGSGGGTNSWPGLPPLP
ncbi:hypothetical protein [Tichowtungia aerotolerans]|uniref:Uncharacterized protein n=1 Tax=Tichowtungia aerotolerans TaxID=2697043 RepID=A0A6P1MD90_9BACT|nr:hypothetical protein [Tichowtungia aerotolerans]QHI69065.1 hypothetical protein GT409_06270 [Tichowtungia aerotolerans]